MTLSDQRCEACHGNAIMVADNEVPALLSEIPGWTLKAVDGVTMLERSFTFKGFKQARAFADRVADLAEAEDHHPAILLEWGRVTVTWWTHTINGLHRNDSICAAKTDQLSPFIRVSTAEENQR